MKIPPAPHSWSVTPRQAIAIQKKLASRVREIRPPTPIRFVAGTDLAFSRDGQRCVAGVVLWDLTHGEVVERHIAVRKLRFPYVPGLLSFREAPAAIAALGKLKITPDALMIDGHGLAHPRRFGIACHLGVVCKLRSIGCAKSRLTGSHKEPGRRRGARCALRDDTTRLGTVLRTRHGVKPVFVSVGHKIDLPTAERVVLECVTRYRLPEPTRLADHLVRDAKRKMGWR